jgi:hypothetical protein
MTYLFIGGHADGKRLAVPDGVSVYRYFHKPLSKVTPSEFGPEPETVMYRAEKFQANNMVIKVFVEKSLTIEDALRMMVENYCAPEKK